MRKAPARRSIPAAAATPTSCSSTPRRRKKNSSRKASASSVTLSCTTTSSWSARKAILPASRESKDIVAALKTLKDKGVAFISRGDKSGTHQAELNLWKIAGIDIATDKGPWYKEIGQGMGAALNTASASNAYVLTDRGTWLSFKNKGDLVIAVEGDKRLFNQYGVMLVNPAKHPNVKKEFGQQFIDWLVSPEGQKAIADYKINGEQLFYPNASDPGVMDLLRGQADRCRDFVRALVAIAPGRGRRHSRLTA